MTGITGICRVDMGGRLTDCNCIIVTTDAGTDNLRMINTGRSDRSPGRRKFFVTGIALISTGNMSNTFTTRIDAVMTGNTVADKRRVIDCSRYPPQSAVTGITF